MLLRTTKGQSALLLLFFGCACALLQNAHAASCTTQSQMTAAQRDTLSGAARTVVAQMRSGDMLGLKANTLPSVAAHFDGIASSVESLKPLLQRATITVDQLYGLDDSGGAPGVSRVEFFCGSPVVVLTFAALPTGTYSLVIVHATGVPQPQQVSLILSKTTDGRWMFAGFFRKPMVEAGHDGLWYWVSARKYAQSKMDWAAWLYYQTAIYLLNPVDFLASSNLGKLRHEADLAHPNPFPGEKPMTINASGSIYTLTAIDTSTDFGGLDLDVHYTPDTTQTAQLRDGPAARKQVTDVMSTLLALHPELREAFHGIWVHADQGNASLFALEMPMSGIPGGGTQPAASPVAR